MSAPVDKLIRLLVMLWAGSLWALALWVAPAIFRILGDRHRAGAVAAELFRIETYLTLALTLILLVRFGSARMRAIYPACAVLLVNEWVLRPMMQRAVAGGQFLGIGFAAWHALSGLLYVAACVAAVLLVWQNDFG